LGQGRGGLLYRDNKTDVEAGFRMGMRTILVLSGKTTRGDVASWDEKPEQIFDDLFEAAQFIVKGV
jgi:ribonucleotide monophosphatase NagD (HAD superfamily)